MAKEKRVVIFNKGVRNWPLKDEGKDVSVAPNKSIELPKSVAARMVKNYPADFIHGDSMAVKDDNEKALRIQIKNLTAENAELKGRIAELGKEILLIDTKPNEEIDLDENPDDPDDTPADGEDE